MKVLILGHKGMLGFVVHQYFKDQNIECITTDYRWPSKEFKNVVENFKGDVIINCIAITVPDKDKININFELPIYLDTNTSCKIVHPGTDNENEMGLYAASKSKASLWILNEGKNYQFNTNNGVMTGDEIERQYQSEKECQFIEDTIEGGLDFTSTDKCVSSIMSILQ